MRMLLHFFPFDSIYWSTKNSSEVMLDLITVDSNNLSINYQHPHAAFNMYFINSNRTQFVHFIFVNRNEMCLYSTAYASYYHMHQSWLNSANRHHFPWHTNHNVFSIHYWMWVCSILSRTAGKSKSWYFASSAWKNDVKNITMYHACILYLLIYSCHIMRHLLGSKWFTFEYFYRL